MKIYNPEVFLKEVRLGNINTWKEVEQVLPFSINPQTYLETEFVNFFLSEVSVAKDIPPSTFSQLTDFYIEVTWYLSELWEYFEEGKDKLQEFYNHKVSNQ